MTVHKFPGVEGYSDNANANADDSSDATYRELIEIVMSRYLAELTKLSLINKLAGNDTKAKEYIASSIDVMRATKWLLQLPSDLCPVVRETKIEDITSDPALLKEIKVLAEDLKTLHEQLFD